MGDRDRWTIRKVGVQKNILHLMGQQHLPGKAHLAQHLGVGSVTLD